VDNRYWPKQEKRRKLAEQGIPVIARARGNQKFRHTPSNAALLKNIGSIESALSVYSTSSST
jgi:hypothetical protein